MMLKKIVFLFVCCLLCVATKAQTDANYSMYMKSKLYYNPAYAGMEDGLSMTGANRLKMRGISNAPTSTYFAISLPIDWLGGGLGMKFVDDKYGLFSDKSFNLIYSHIMRIWRGKMGLGLQAGIMQHGFDGSKAKPVPDTGGGGSDQFHGGSDPVIPSGDAKGIIGDFGLGGYYEDEQLYMGFSMMHLLQSTSKLGEVAGTYVPRTVFLTGGYLMNTSVSELKLQPSVMIKTDFSTTQMDIDMLGIYNKQFWGGLGYRWGDAVIFMFGVDLINGLTIGYSYDMGVSKLVGLADGSQELTVTYRMSLDFNKNRDKYKSIRIL